MPQQEKGSESGARVKKKTTTQYVASEILRTICKPAGCAYAQEPTIPSDIYRCWAIGMTAPSIIRKLGESGRGCENALIDVPGTLKVDLRFIPKRI